MGGGGDLMRQELREKKRIYKVTIIVYIYTVTVTILKIYIYLAQLMSVILRLECVNLIYFFIYTLTGANAFTCQLYFGSYVLFFFFFFKQVTCFSFDLLLLLLIHVKVSIISYHQPS